MNFFARYLPLALVVVALRGLGQAPPTQPPAQSQTAASATATVEMLSDPVAMLNLARERNGLDAIGVNPFHLKVSYELFDDKGAVKEAGTIEHFRASQKRFKTIYSSPAFNQIEIANEKGTF
jgi:hypothetical protein